MSKLAIFYHVARLGPRWLEIDKQISEAMHASGLMDSADVIVRNDCRDTDLYEFPTLDMLVAFAQHHPGYFVLYLHTKGVSHVDKPSIDDWRECMLFWMVERWRDCVRKLEQGFEAVGINEHEKPLRHFQGNFWWTTTKYLRTRGQLREINFIPSVHNQTERHKAEFWLLHGGTRVYSPYHHRVNPYLVRNPRSNYASRRF